MTGPLGQRPAGHRRTEGSEAAQQRVTAGRRRFAGRTALVFFTAIAAAVLFVAVLLLVTSSSAVVLRLDRSTAADLHGFARSHSGFTAAMRAISNAGSTPVWLTVMALVAGWLLWRRLRRLAAFVVVTALGSSLLNNVVKLLVNRARPQLADPVALAAGKSFPSGHAQAAIVGYGVLLAVFLPVIGRRWRVPAAAVAVLLVLAIGFSRIALGVHYLSDVIGAYLIGTVWLLGLASAFRTRRREEGKPVVGIDEGLEPEHRDQLAP